MSEQEEIIKRIKAETNLLVFQLELEKDKIKHTKDWHESHQFIILKAILQSFVAGIILAGTFFYLFQPIIDTQKSIAQEESKISYLKASQAELSSKIETEKNRLLKQENNRKSRVLESKNKRIINELEIIKNANKIFTSKLEQNKINMNTLQVELKNIKSEYKKMSHNVLVSKKDKLKYKKLAKITQFKLSELEKENLSTKTALNIYSETLIKSIFNKEINGNLDEEIKKRIEELIKSDDINISLE